MVLIAAACLAAGCRASPSPLFEAGERCQAIEGRSYGVIASADGERVELGQARIGANNCTVELVVYPGALEAAAWAQGLEGGDIVVRSIADDVLLVQIDFKERRPERERYLYYAGLVLRMGAAQTIVLLDLACPTRPYICPMPEGARGEALIRETADNAFNGSLNETLGNEREFGRDVAAMLREQ